MIKYLYLSINVLILTLHPSPALAGNTVVVSGYTFTCDWIKTQDGKAYDSPTLAEIAAPSCGGEKVVTRRCQGVGKCFTDVRGKRYWLTKTAVCALPKSGSMRCSEWTFADCFHDSSAPDKFYSRDQEDEFVRMWEQHAAAIPSGDIHFTAK